MVFLVMTPSLCYFKIMIPQFMKYSRPKKIKYKFDFEIGYLTKSPCKNCARKKDIPGCIDACDMLDKIHTVLLEAVSCSRRS